MGQPTIEEKVPMDLVRHLRRHIKFSERTFGPNPRTEVLSDQIRRGLREIDLSSPEMRPEEWVDVVILALDGLWRSLAYDRNRHVLIAEEACRLIEEKQTKNEGRRWPDWRSMDPNGAIEHVRDEA